MPKKKKPTQESLEERLLKLRRRYLQPVPETEVTPEYGLFGTKVRYGLLAVLGAGLLTLSVYFGNQFLKSLPPYLTQPSPTTEIVTEATPTPLSIAVDVHQPTETIIPTESSCELLEYVIQEGDTSGRICREKVGGCSVYEDCLESIASQVSSGDYNRIGVGEVLELYFPKESIFPTSTLPPSAYVPRIREDMEEFLKLWKSAEIPQESVSEHLLLPGEVLYVSASHFKVGSVSCDNNNRSDFLCVYVHQAAQEETVKIENLVPGHAWIGVADELGIQEVIDDRMPFWWDPSNCVNGCNEVQVIVRYADGSISYLPIYTK